MSRRLDEDQLRNIFRAASSKKDIAAPQSSGVKSEKLLGKGMTLMAYDLFPCPRGQKILPEVCELAGAFARRLGRGF